MYTQVNVGLTAENIEIRMGCRMRHSKLQNLKWLPHRVKGLGNQNLLSCITFMVDWFLPFNMFIFNNWYWLMFWLVLIIWTDAQWYISDKKKYIYCPHQLYKFYWHTFLLLFYLLLSVPLWYHQYAFFILKVMKDSFCTFDI